MKSYLFIFLLISPIAKYKTGEIRNSCMDAAISFVLMETIPKVQSYKPIKVMMIRRLI